MNEKYALLIEERLKMVVEGFRMGFWEWDLTTGEVLRNTHWAEMLGYSIEEFANDADAWTQLLHPEDRDNVWGAVHDHLNGQCEVFRMEYRMRAKNGEFRWILDVAKVVHRSADGKPVRMSGAHMDITEQKKYEQEREALIGSLQNALKELKSLRGILPICMYCHDIRSEDGVWDRIETYLTRHSDAEFSHSICPNCLDKAKKEAGLM